MIFGNSQALFRYACHILRSSVFYFFSYCNYVDYYIVALYFQYKLKKATLWKEKGDIKHKAIVYEAKAQKPIAFILQNK